MRILVCMCILSGCLAAQDPAKTTSPPSAAKQTKKAPAVTAIPKDAVETTPGFYRWTDKDGKAWTYRRTPFGVTRWPANSVDMGQEAADKQNAASGRTTAVEAGDSVRFEQATPFGKRTWVRKKTELNDAEQKIWDLQQKNSAASRTAEKE
ncbi:MAG TPA: hypothetical protein VN924_04245 [Bryobacteraceae bacterium]|nr:hypothetical protein [Bryobacteraceae bacterium]